jgi:signal transduction histidine kinase
MMIADNTGGWVVGRNVDGSTNSAQARRESLLGLARRCAAEPDVERVLRWLLEEAVRQLGGDDGGIAHWDEERRQLVQVQSYLPSESTGTLLSLERSASGRAARERRTVLMNDYRREGDPNSPAGRIGARAGVAVPLLHEGRLLGTLSVASYREGQRYTLEDATILEELAGLGASALVGRERARLEAALEIRTEVLRDVAHDLKSPLTAVQARVDLLRMELARAEPRPERIQESMHWLSRGVERMATLVDQLQDVVHLEAGQPLDLVKRRTDLVELVREAAQAQPPTEAGHEVRVETDLADLVGRWDRGRLGRVLDNLLSNAIKYSPGGGEVVVALSSQDGWAVVAVRDQGVGIPVAELSRVFDRWFRGRNVSGRMRGSGIGLAGTRQIVEQHGGSIEVTSEEDVGSTFTIRLPLTEPMQADDE